MATSATYAPVGSKTAVEEDREASPLRSIVNNDGPEQFSRRARAWLDDGWLLEVACAVLGVLLVITLALVLRTYDKLPVPQFGAAFGSSLTLNTVVAIIVAASRAALLLPVAACVSQLKWQWMASKDRNLVDMATFDSASRGIMGGFALLWKTKLR